MPRSAARAKSTTFPSRRPSLALLIWQSLNRFRDMFRSHEPRHLYSRRINSSPFCILSLDCDQYEGLFLFNFISLAPNTNFANRQRRSMCWTHDFYSTFHTIPQAFTVYVLSIMLWAIYWSSVAQSCPTCDPVDYSTSGFPVIHHLPVFAQTHVHWVGDAIKPSHPLLSLSPTFNLSQQQDLFQSVGFSH